MENHAECTMGTRPLIDSAIGNPCAKRTMVDYLPNRSPLIFRREGSMCLNNVAGSRGAFSTESILPADMLEHLMLNVEEDLHSMYLEIRDAQSLRARRMHLHFVGPRTQSDLEGSCVWNSALPAQRP